MKTFRRFLSVVLLVAAVLAMAAWANGSKAAERPGTSVRVRALAITVPRGLGRYDIRGGIYRTGTRPPVIGLLATDDPRAHLRGQGFAKWSALSSNGPPAKKVALALSLDVNIGPDPPPTALRLHLPLSLHQHWFREHLSNGRRGYRWGYLHFHRQFYEVMFWSGRSAPARDRAAALNALTSIHLAR